MTTVLVTGGAGYIGSHTVRQLVRSGHHVVVVDNLYSGHRWAVDPAADFIPGDAGDHEQISALIRAHRIEAVVHFAGHIVVPESVADPLKYYRNNSVNSQRLIQACCDNQVEQIIFSSTAAVYGAPASIPVSEDTPTAPINPYGRSKLITEWMLRDVAISTASNNHPVRYCALRYFNVAGAALDGRLGQATPEATHLIKVACETVVGKRASLQIFGTDYPTEDGTCVRDYIHVEDLATAHVAALEYLLNGGSSQILNCGYGRGYSVRQVVDMMRSLGEGDFSVEETGRRAGDPPALVADTRRIRELLSWTPRHDDLEVICRTALQWEAGLAERSSEIA